MTPNPAALFSTGDFDVELDDKPVRDQLRTGEFGQDRARQTINIDENEDTIHTRAGFDKIMQRGKRL